jgi:hypothetical protein
VTLYATLYQLRAYLGLDAEDTADDARLLDLLIGSCKFIDTQYRRCDVRRELRRLNYPLPQERSFMGVFSAEQWVSQMNATVDIAAGLLRLDDDLLEAVTVTNGDGSVLDASDFVYEPPNMTPRHGIRLQPSAGKIWLPASNGNTRQVIQVLGWWGWHDDYESAFADSLDTVQNDPLGPDATSLTVSSITGFTADLRSPRFQVGQVLRLQAELALIVALDDGVTKTLMLRRAYNGTLAAQHAKGTRIEIFRPPANVELAALRLATWRYRQKDANVFDKTTILATGEQITPSSLPPDVRDLLPPRRIRIS